MIAVELAHVDNIGSILRRLRVGCEATMTTIFDPHLSLRIDDLVQREEDRRC